MEGRERNMKETWQDMNVSWRKISERNAKWKEHERKTTHSLTHTLHMAAVHVHTQLRLSVQPGKDTKAAQNQNMYRWLLGEAGSLRH